MDTPRGPDEPTRQDAQSPPISIDGNNLSHDVDAPAQPRIEGYQVVRLIGQGGMGTVWEARQLSTRRRVAIKTIRGSAFDSPRARQRFRREIEVLATLQHPHIARLYDSSADTHVAYYVMEYVEGQPIDQYCRDRGLEPRQILSLFVTVCRAVDYAQRSGFVHRDLKPSNMLIRPDASPCILDFGLARPMETDGRHPTLTGEGGLVGTLAYMAPELAADRAGCINATCDVYSLGVILYQLLTSRLPHEPSPSLYEHQRRIVETDPPSCRRINRRLDREIEALLAKALARDPQDRYRDAGELAGDIDNYLKGNPLQARQLTLGYVLRRRIVQHRVRFAVILLAVAALLGGVSYSYWRINEARQLAERREAERSQALYVSRFREAFRAYGEDDLARAQRLLAGCPEAYRGWEWRYLRGLADQSLWTFTVPTDPRAVALDAEGRARVLDRDGLLYTCSPDMAQPVRTVLTDRPVSAVALNTAATHAALALPDQIHVVDLRTLTATPLPLPQAGDVARMVLSPDGALLAAALHRGPTIVWNTKRAKRVHLSSQPAVVTGLGLTSDALLVTDDQSIRLVRLTPQPQSAAVRPVAVEQRKIAADHDGRTIYLANNRDILVMDGEASDDDARLLHRAEAILGGFDVHPHARTLALTDGDAVRLLADGEDLMLTLRGHTGTGHAVRFDASGNRLISAADREIKIWDPDAAFQPRYDIAAITDADQVLTMHWSDSGRELLLGVADGRLVRAALPDGRTIAEYRVAHPPIALGHTADHEADAVGVLTQRGLLHEVDLSTGQIRTRSSPYPLPASLSPDGRYVIRPSAASGATCEVYAVTAPDQPVATIPGRMPAWWSRNGRRLVMADPTDPGRIMLWTTDDWRHPKILTTPDMPMGGWTHLALSDDGRFIAAARGDGLWVWSTDDARPARHLDTEHAGLVESLAISSDGTRTLIGSAGTVVILNTATGETLCNLDTGAPGRSVLTLSFSPDQRHLAVAGAGFAVVWSAPP